MTNPNINQILPPQAGNNMKVLTTDGEVASWETVGSGGTAVTSLNSETGAISLISSDSSVTITPSGSTIDLQASGGGLTTPTIVQSVFGSSNSGSFSVTLGSAPTAGNVLVAFCWGTSNGLNCFPFACELYQQNNPGIYVFSRRVQSGDATNVFAVSNNGNYQYVMLYEIAGMNDMFIAASQISNSLNTTTQYAPIARAFSPTIAISCLVVNNTGLTVSSTSSGWSTDHDPTSDNNVQGIVLRRSSTLAIATTDQAWVTWSSNGGNHTEATILIR